MNLSPAQVETCAAVSIILSLAALLMVGSVAGYLAIVLLFQL